MARFLLLEPAMRAAGAILFVGLAACAPAVVRGDEDEHAATRGAREAFTSAQAGLAWFEFDGAIVTDSAEPATLDRLIQTQLLFTVGQLNGELSVGRIDHSTYGVTMVVAKPTTPPAFEVAYHAAMPVAWGQGTPPTTFGIVLPRRVDAAAQDAFAQKYSGACTDPEGGAVASGEMFLFFRPHRAGCAIDPADVVTTTATIRADAAGAAGKYPEYHRVWDDDELDVVAVFGRALPDPNDHRDEGTDAYLAFVDRAHRYLSEQALSAPIVEETDRATTEPTVRLSATLADGRRVRLDVISVAPSLRDDPELDRWYDARTPDADLIVYSGHAGLGDNVRAIMAKGAFRPRKYVVAVMNGCDTFAYLDDTLAKRRAVLNPDDPEGTRYMDSVTNVLGGYFHSEAQTTLLLLDAFVSAGAGAPKPYREIFAAVDPTQIMVVTGEEDNEFAPGMLPARPPAAAAAAVAPSREETGGGGGQRADSTESVPRSIHHARCDAAGGIGSTSPRDAAILFAFAFAFVGLLRRYRGRRSASARVHG